MSKEYNLLKDCRADDFCNVFSFIQTRQGKVLKRKKAICDLRKHLLRARALDRQNNETHKHRQASGIKQSLAILFEDESYIEFDKLYQLISFAISNRLEPLAYKKAASLFIGDDFYPNSTQSLFDRDKLLCYLAKACKRNTNSSLSDLTKTTLREKLVRKILEETKNMTATEQIQYFLDKL